MDLRSRLQAALADRYTLERELGHGGMATVYLARDLKHRRAVALKVLHPDLAVVLGPARFLREIEVAANFTHPHILPVFDSGEAGGLLWYAMPYVEGESLRERLSREIQLSVDEAVRITREVADALGYAHEQGIVHRDIKPENILVLRGHALVADFGIAKAVEAAGAERLTETGLAIGTPAYMSPEQASGSKQVGARSDVYSLGCVLYEMLAGEPPFTGPTAQAVLAKSLVGPLPSVRITRPDVPTRLETVIQRALAQVPAARFPSAGEFAHALAQATATAPTSDAPLLEVARPKLAGHRLAGLGLALLVLVAGTVLLARARDAKPPTPAGPTMRAVLPFKNLGAPAEQYFADGLTEEITSRLAAVGSLGVISRTSADRYRNTTRPLKEIGRELGVGYILEGSVRWERRPDGTSRVRVTPQLIQVAYDRHLWTERYDADLREVFQVQSGIAEQVTNALGVALAAPERQVLAARPTANLSAYDAYLRGNALYPSDPSAGPDQLVTGFQRAAEQYREAVRLDSTFALAYAKLGTTTLDLYSFVATDSSTAATAKGAIDRALALAPELSDAHLARGWYHLQIDRDTTRALRELEIALANRPNDAELLMELALMEGLARGPSSQAIPRAERAVQLDPHTPARLLGLARLYRDVQRFDDSERLYDRVIALEPKSPGPYSLKALIHLLRDGDTASSRAIIREAAQHVDSLRLITAVGTRLATWHALGMLEESYQQALLKLSPGAFGGDAAWYGLVKGYTYRARGGRFWAYYDTAFDAATAKLRAAPNDMFYRSITAWVLAGRGRRAEAFAAMAKARTSTGLQYWQNFGEIEAPLAVIAGDFERALDVLERGNWGPQLTIPWLKADPFWDPLRRNPRFQRLLERKQ